jgi:hypothetical protein
MHQMHIIQFLTKECLIYIQRYNTISLLRETWISVKLMDAPWIASSQWITLWSICTVIITRLLYISGSTFSDPCKLNDSNWALSARHMPASVKILLKRDVISLLLSGRLSSLPVEAWRGIGPTFTRNVFWLGSQWFFRSIPSDDHWHKSLYRLRALISMVFEM